MSSTEGATTVPPLPDPRRILTGHDATGKAVVTNDGLLESKIIYPGIRSCDIWTTESLPTKENNSSEDFVTRPIPGLGLVLPNGINHRFTDLAPGATAPMHRSNSVDYNILLSGRLVLILDDDVRTEVQPGNVIVQRGTVHGWYNPSTTEWARWVSVLIHAEPVKVGGKELEEIWQG